MSGDDQAGEQVTGTVTRVYPSKGANDPHAFYVNGDRYTTFDDVDVAAIEEGIDVQFRYEQNGEYRNVVADSVDVVDADRDDAERGRTAGIKGGESSRDRSIRTNVALKQAREFCQPLVDEDVSEARVREIRDMVLETADVFAMQLQEMNHGQGEP